jgi:hypothetical protein
MGQREKNSTLHNIGPFIGLGGASLPQFLFLLNNGGKLNWLIAKRRKLNWGKHLI